jgi:hypothetical protein
METGAQGRSGPDARKGASICDEFTVLNNAVPIFFKRFLPNLSPKGHRVAAESGTLPAFR